MLYNDELYCKLFLDSDVDEMELRRMLCQLLNAESRFKTISADNFEADVNRNDVFDCSKRNDSMDGFLHYRYFLDIVPNGDIGEFGYISSIARLMNELYSMGIKTVAACTFECKLPKFL